MTTFELRGKSGQVTLGTVEMTSGTLSLSPDASYFDYDLLLCRAHDLDDKYFLQYA